MLDFGLDTLTIEEMKMEIGSQTSRQIILKLRTRLKGLLAEHEVKSPLTSHIILMQQICEKVDRANKRNEN